MPGVVTIVPPIAKLPCSWMARGASALAFCAGAADKAMMLATSNNDATRDERGRSAMAAAISRE